MSKSALRLALRFAVLSVVSVGCNAVLGIGDSPTVKSQAQACLLNSDCPTNDICVFERCSNPCAADRDCKDGLRCLRTDDGGACIGSDTTQCGTSARATCPAGAECLDNVCRSACGAASPCFEDQRCGADGVCVGLDPGRDPGASDAGNGGGRHDGGAGGRGGSGGRGGGGASGAGGGTASGGVSGGAGGLGGSSGAPDLDAGGDAQADAGPKCGPEGALRCEGGAQALRSKCTAGRWIPATPCATDQLCDGPSGTCMAVPSVCKGQAPGKPFCDGMIRTQCGPDLVTVATATCPTTQHCSLSTTATCAACLPGEYSCDGVNLQVCKADRSGFEFFQKCTTAAPCNEAAKACTALACLPNQKRCNGDALEVCNGMQTGWSLSKQCAAGLCDAVALECDICAGGTVSCLTGTSQLACNADGQTQTTPDCPAPTPYCVGKGQCVACSADAHCTAPDDCHTATCNTSTGACAFPPRGAGQKCSGGVCDGTKCVQCLTPTDCGAPVDSCHVVTCASNKCGSALKNPGDACTGGRCTAAGACVQCVGAGDCTASPGECYTPTCPAGGGSCTYPKKVEGVGCSGGVCAASGACVACVANAQCAAGTTCQPGSCDTTTNKCQTKPAASRTLCTGGVCNGTGACVPCVVNADCGFSTSQICRTNACISSTDYAGWNTQLASSASMGIDTLYFFQLPPLAHPASLTAFGAWGNATGASVKMALYADDGTGTRPSGAPLSETSTPINLVDGAREVQGTLSVALASGATYWVAIIANATTTFRSQAAAAAKGYRIVGAGYGNFFPTVAAAPGNALNGVNWNVYIVVQDTQ